MYENYFCPAEHFMAWDQSAKAFSTVSYFSPCMRTPIPVSFRVTACHFFAPDPGLLLDSLFRPLKVGQTGLRKEKEYETRKVLSQSCRFFVA
jgi:hypothetical protein